MTRICVIKSTSPDKPIPTWNDWIRWIHYESNRAHGCSLRKLEKQVKTK